MADPVGKNELYPKTNPVVVTPPPRPGTTTHTTTTTRVEDEITKKGGRFGNKLNDDDKKWIKTVGAVVAAAVAFSAGVAYYRGRQDEGVVDATKKQFRRGKGKAEDLVDGGKDNVKRGWFGLKRASSDTADAAASKGRYAADKAGHAWDDASSTAYRKGHEAKEGAKGVFSAAGDKAGELKDAVHDKAHDAKEVTIKAAKGTAATTGDVLEAAGRKIKEGGAFVEGKGQDLEHSYRPEPKQCAIM